jgi:hypothetical protein
MARDAVRHAQMRVRIAQAAARLIAEDGVADFGLAKRKAARQLGAPDSHSLPSNEEVEMALDAHHRLFVADPVSPLRALREQALEVMRALADFHPCLVGGVATGRVAGLARGLEPSRTPIEIDLYLDSSKAFEQFLVNQDIEFRSIEQGGRTVYQLYSDPADVWIRIRPENALHADNPGREEPLRRLSMTQLELLLNGAIDPDQDSASQRAASRA